jgi:hypothetical protein
MTKITTRGGYEYCCLQHRIDGFYINVRYVMMQYTMQKLSHPLLLSKKITSGAAVLGGRWGGVGICCNIWTAIYTTAEFNKAQA